MFKAHALVLTLLFTSAHGARAEEANQTVIKTEDAAGRKNKVDGDIDQEVTNRKMRADSGSKSKFSGSLSGGYTGGSLTRAFGANRPNLSGQPGDQTFTSLDLGLNARYRRTKNDSFTFGTLFGVVTPFQGRTNKNISKDSVNVNDPMLGYNRVGKLGPLQSVANFLYMNGTSISSRDVDQTHQFQLTSSLMKSFQSGLSIGAGISTGYRFYDTKPGAHTNKLEEQGIYDPGYYGGDHRSQWTLSVFPQLEYTLTDKLSVRTVFGYANFKHLYGDPNRYRLLQTVVYQSVGVGISVARDIYLYPNIQFVPDNIRGDFTNVALQGMINIF